MVPAPPACHDGATPVPLEVKTYPLVPGLLDAHAAYSAGYVRKTFTEPEKVTALPEFEDAAIVVRVKVGPVVE